MPWSDRKSTSLNSSHTDIYTLSLHDALPICGSNSRMASTISTVFVPGWREIARIIPREPLNHAMVRSEEHKSELQSHRYLHSFPPRRSSDLWQQLANGIDDFHGIRSWLAGNRENHTAGTVEPCHG